MNLKYQYRYLTSLLKRYGFRGLVLKTLERSKSPMLSYTKNYLRYQPTAEELAEQRKTPLAYAPLVSIVLPAYETPKRYLCELMDSVLRQTYPNLELCIADGSSTDAVEKTAEEYMRRDARIRYVRLSGNGGISENTNGGFSMAEGEYLALIDHDDLLAEHAVYEMVRCLNDCYGEEERESAMIYSDEDKINAEGTVHSRPHFKPDFNLEFLRHNNYFCHFLMFSAKLLQKAGGLNKAYDGAQDFDFVLRCVDAGAIVRHVPKILYHWRIHEGSTAGNSADKAYAFDSGCRAIEEHLNRNNEAGRANVTTNLGVYRIAYELKGEYEITVAAEDKTQLEEIRDYCKKNARALHTEAYRINVHYVWIKSFHNGIEKECIGDYILYIRRDTKAKPDGLFERLLEVCQHTSVGIAGAKLLTRNKRVASCGLIYDKDGNLVPANGGLYAEYKGYFLHAVIPKQVSAISFGCVMIKREALIKAGGAAEELSGTYADADICFRLQKSGYRVIVVPDVTAVQMRAADKAQRNRTDVKRQKQIFSKRWKGKLSHPDPCYNPNLRIQEDHTYEMKQ